MNKLVFGTFYTRGTPYETVVRDYFEKSLKKFNARSLITIVENKGSWLKNVAEKPKIILNQLEMLRENERLVFLDADATIEKWPRLLEEIPPDYDFGFHMLSWRQWYGYDTDTYELLSGTLFLKNSKAMQGLCKEWYEVALKYQEWEQAVLQKVLLNHKVNVYELPLEYTYIKCRPSGEEPLVKCDPFILHHQASRTLKKLIKG